MPRLKIHVDLVVDKGWRNLAAVIWIMYLNHRQRRQNMNLTQEHCGTQEPCICRTHSRVSSISLCLSVGCVRQFEEVTMWRRLLWKNDDAWSVLQSDWEKLHHFCESLQFPPRHTLGMRLIFIIRPSEFWFGTAVRVGPDVSICYYVTLLSYYQLFQMFD